MTDIPETLFAFATERQAEVLRAIQEHGGIRAAARALCVHYSCVSRQLKAVEMKAGGEKPGVIPESPERDGTGEGYVIKGVSTFYDGDGNVRGQWVKTKVDDEARLQLIRAAIAEMAAEIPRAAPVAIPAHTQDNLLNLYTFTDCHVGMLAWRHEGGADWDMSIAERTLTGCFEQMILSAPAASVGFINQLGDFLHTDGLMPVTPTSGHILDTDGRFSKMVRVAIRILRRIVDLALTKHEKVVIVMAEGNHDMASSVWLRIMFKVLYENEPRVEVIDSELPFYAYEHGNTMLAFHHGHLKKVEEFPVVFAAQYAPMWGRTTKRYAHAGHRHHLHEKEHGGMLVTQHQTLAARDGYAARGGWFAERAASCITYHSKFGMVGKIVVCPEMLEDPE